MKEQSHKTLVLLDSHAIIHRAYHALPDFVSSGGEPTGALYGLSTMLLKIIADLKPDYIIACYDLPQKTFRHEAYEAYKAGRVKADPALIAQLESSKKIFEVFGIPIYSSPGFEADDILGTITTLLSKTNITTIIASGDMDTLQLVDGTRVKVYTLRKGIADTVVYDEKAVIERFGFAPEFLPDYKGLRGDPSDNIIGIKGIGEKTAQILISNFGTIESIYKKLKTKTGVEQFKKVGITDRIIGLLKEGEEEALFSKTLATVRKDAPIAFVIPQKTFAENFNAEVVVTLFRELEFRSLVARIESLYHLAKESSAPEEAREEDTETVEKLKIGLWLLNSDITNPTLPDILAFENSKTLAQAKKNIEKAVENRGLSYVYHSIELPLIPIIKEMERHGVKIDLSYLAKLSKEYHAELSKLEKDIWNMAGREFNVNSPKQLGDVLFDELKIGTSARLKKTAGGARSTRESELLKLKDAHPIIDKLFKYRELQKLLSTYIDTIPNLVAADGRLHATFNQAGSTTGRFSSQNPNLQNIPIKSELGKNIRNAFVAEKGCTLLAFDYSQIELRVAAVLSGDPYLTQVFTEGKDVHTAVAMRVFKVNENEVTHEMRRRAKVINFGILYGMGVTALQQNLGTNRKEAQEFYDNYFKEFPTIEGYLESVITFAKERGYTETLFGRRRYFPGLSSKIPYIRAMAERMAINAPIQGTATADIIKRAIIEVHEHLEKEKLLSSVHLILQVHDELIYEVEDSVIEKAKEVIKTTMEAGIPKEFLGARREVPLVVGVEAGKNWGEMD